MEGLVNRSAANADFYKGKTVFLTGHTGFKGSWLSLALVKAGARVVGYSLVPPTDPNLYDIAGIADLVDTHIGDVRDFDSLDRAMRQAKPDIVMHLAAQPIVLEGYRQPRYTYETNVMGTVNVLEAARNVDAIGSILNVTTDKVYLNKELEEYGYKEEDPLDGHDPYSNSKSCSELVTHSYAKSFFHDAGVAVSTARAGNVIGGGDFADDRIIPDCVRAVQAHQPLVVRNPISVRPYQHVLESVFAYLLIAEKQMEDPSLASSYNVGPDDCDCVTTGELVQLFAQKWGEGFSMSIASDIEIAPHEANFLKLDSSKLKRVMRWQPRWHIEDAVGATVEWTKRYLNEASVQDVMIDQVDAYQSIFKA